MKNHGKDQSPLVTVGKIKKIFDSLGIEIVEYWQSANEIGTFALRVFIKNTQIGANGKGISKEYAAASAYAELLERLANTHYGSNMTQYIYSTACDLPQIPCEGYEKNTDKLAESFPELFESDYQIEKSVKLPYKCLNNGEYIMIPQTFIESVYGTNGMCAGNTKEEALVQGFCEIEERRAIKEIYEDRRNVTPFDLRDTDFFDKNPVISQFVSQVEGKYNYQFFDCSGAAPCKVIAVAISTGEDGLYGVKFGCHPSAEIAVERVLTELTQGNSISSYADLNRFCYKAKAEVCSQLAMIFRDGKGAHPFRIVCNEKPQKVSPELSDREEGNKFLLDRFQKYYVKNGVKVYIRDVSHLGMPSFQIVIPTISEMYGKSMHRMTKMIKKSRIIDILKAPSEITEVEAREIVDFLDDNAMTAESIASLYPWYGGYDLPFSDVGLGIDYLYAMCYYMIRNYAEAENRLNEMLLRLKSDKEKRQFVSALTVGISGLRNAVPTSMVESNLRFLFPRATVDVVVNILANRKAIFAEQYPTFEKGKQPYELKVCEELLKRCLSQEAKAMIK